MRLPALLRAYRDYINEAGIVRFEQPELTVYAAPAKNLFCCQRKAMELLRHLDVAPQPAPLLRLRGFNVMKSCHHPLSDFMSVWHGQTREGKIELVRRLGATMGMVHSLRHSGTGDILCPRLRPVATSIIGTIRRSIVLLTVQQRRSAYPGKLSGIEKDILSLWGNEGGTLTGNWSGFPPVKIWDSGLMIMDMSRARYSEPLLDLINIRPQVIGLADIDFFWEYFLQGYCATCELPAHWQEKIELLYQIKYIHAVAQGWDAGEAAGDFQNKWWKKYNNYL